MKEKVLELEGFNKNAIEFKEAQSLNYRPKLPIKDKVIQIN